MSQDRFSLEGRVVLVTGASSGLGSHMAGLFADAGASVVLGARRVDRLEARGKELRAAGHAAQAVALDVTDAASIVAALDAAQADAGLPDVVVNNAGVEAGVFTYMTLDEDAWDAVMATNLKGAWLVSKEISRRWEAAKRGGNIVNVASILGFRQQKGVTPYAVSKAGLVQLTKQIALEGARYGIRANAIAPGYFHSAVSSRLLDSDEFLEFSKKIPQRRAGEIDDYDGALLLLASEASAHMTGQTVAVDGGHLVSSL
ncbi:MAG: SDR family NAD(P)-dependent oxidoreductase [Pseudomonadales bacterium]|jgi:NAD(P)-dependent dehydrogenase (short-subunit alcohol dehydrogenase family)|nr:SDR family NAD(P)-dependent oxidoreductase [Pseudomonadales bacterium]